MFGEADFEVILRDIIINDDLRRLTGVTDIVKQMVTEIDPKRSIID